MARNEIGFGIVFGKNNEDMRNGKVTAIPERFPNCTTAKGASLKKSFQE